VSIGAEEVVLFEGSPLFVGGVLLERKRRLVETGRPGWPGQGNWFFEEDINTPSGITVSGRWREREGERVLLGGKSSQEFEGGVFDPSLVDHFEKKRMRHWEGDEHIVFSLHLGGSFGGVWGSKKDTGNVSDR